MDYDDYDDQNNPTFRWVSVIVLLMAVTGFMSLAWYAYQTGTDHASSDSGDIIQAESTPIKEKPVDAGGVQFPHQEKTIYDVIDKNSDQTESVKLMEPSEEPLKQVEEVEEKSIEKPIEKVEGLVPAKGSQSADKKIAEILKKAVDDSKESLKSDAPSTAKASEAALKKAPDPFAPVKKEEPVKKVEAAPVAPVTTSSAKVQLGAFQSEAEARIFWNNLKAKNADVVGSLNYDIIRADLGEKGIYHRLRASGFASSAKAAEACKILVGRSLGCFVVQ